MSGEHALRAARLALLVGKLPMPPGYQSSALWLLGSEGSSWEPHSKLRSGCRAQYNPDARLWGHYSVSLATSNRHRGHSWALQPYPGFALMRLFILLHSYVGKASLYFRVGNSQQRVQEVSSVLLLHSSYPGSRQGTLVPTMPWLQCICSDLLFEDTIT